MKQYLEFSDGASNKFWSVSTDGGLVTVVFGKIGTAGQTQIKDFGSADEAEKQAQKQAKSKIAKGYAPATPPEGFGASPIATVKPAATPAAPKAPKVAKPLGPVVDDGTLQPWHHEDGDFWEYSWHCCDEESFAIESLSRAEGDDQPAPPTAPKTQKPAVTEEKPMFNWGLDRDGGYRMSSTDDDDDDDDDDEGPTFSKRGFASIARSKPLTELIAAWEAAKAAGIEQKQLTAALDYAYTRTLAWTLHQNSLTNLQWLLEQGAKTDDSSYLIDDPFAKFIIKTHKETTDAAKTMQALDGFFDRGYDKMADALAKGLRAAVAALAAGQADEKSGIKRLPPSDQLATLSGLQLQSYQDICYIYPMLFGESSSTSLFRAEIKDLDGINDDIAAKYLPAKLRPLIDAMAAEGLFDQFPATRVCIAYKGGEVFFEKVIDQSGYDLEVLAAQNLVERLEQTTEFKDDADELSLACYYLINKLTPVDVPRISALLGRFLYSLNDDAEEAANDMLCKYDDQFTQLEYDRAMWLQANGHYQPAHNVMGNAAFDGYAPAKEKMVEFEQLAAQRAKRLKVAAAPKKVSGRKKVSFNQFTQADLFIDTDDIIARADANGIIRLRFKIEGEAGYSQALDYLNNLLDKGYARIHDGYTLLVRLLRKPEFIKQLPDFPKNTCHAFFAAAVKYPALREKVRRYADLAMVEFDWYKDLDGEENTLPGTFAACALAFCDPAYIGMAGQYGRTSDNEHQYIQLHVAPALAKAYGATPEVAKAIFDISCSNGQDGEMGRLPKDLWMQPANLAAVMEHIEDGTALQHHVDVHIVGYVEAIMGYEVKSNLKKLVIAAKAAPLEDQKIFEDFYNLYKNYASEYNNEDYGNDLALTSKAAASGAALPEYNEGEPTVMSLKEFQEKYPNREIDEGYEAERRTVVFSPTAVTNPYMADYFHKSWSLLGKIAREAPTSFFWHPIVLPMGNWIINLTAPAKEYGVILFDGKNKPIVMYGKFNIVPLFTRFHKRPFKTSQEAEIARQAHMMEEADDFTPIPEELKGALDRYDTVASALITERYYAAGQVFPTFTPADRFFYDAALIQRAMLAHIMVDPDAEKAAYEELQTRLPQYAEYWEEKLKSLG